MNNRDLDWGDVEADGNEIAKAASTEYGTPVGWPEVPENWGPEGRIASPMAVRMRALSAHHAQEMYDRMEAEHETGRRFAWDRDEHDACEAGTEGCSIDHKRETEQGLRGEGCDVW